MYGIIKLTIMSGNFKLSEIQKRIKRLYAMGDITDTQMDELLSLMAEKANPEIERPETLDLIQNLFARVNDLAARVKRLEAGNAEEGAVVHSDSEYPAWEPWDGLSNKYQPGAVVSHNDQLWESVYAGQNVWEPGVVDQRFWIPYVGEA